MSDSSSNKEYIVTLKNSSDLDNFYTDMEESGGSEKVPDRQVECVERRNISRNTHYKLTEEEVSKLKSDNRVLDIEEPYYNRGIELGVDWDAAQDGNWDKSPDAASDKNWGLKRCIDAQQTANWGTNGTSQITGSVNTTSSGKNVDVVIVDEHINFGHPEFRENPDGTGNLRSNEFNWFQYSSALGYSTEATYTYTSVAGSHGTHTAGITAGNTQGWARDANVYNMEFIKDYVAGNPANWAYWLWDYVRYFHKNKSINATTGRRNPTIMNNSWSSGFNPIYLNSTQTLTSVRYRGTVTSLSGTSSEKKTVLEDNGVPVPGNTYLWRTPNRDSAMDADIQDAINDGVIVVAAAGNSYWNCDTSGGDDYDNYIYGTGGIFGSGAILYHSRGASPGAADNVICVGNIDRYVTEYKRDSSNWGERVDIWAPGSNIMSSVYNSSSGYSNSQQDPRNSSYYNASTSGTSMSSPQISGLLACLAEQWPNMKAADALQFLKETSKDQVATTGTINHTGYYAFGDSNNRYVYYDYRRPQTGTVFPHDNAGNRNESTAGVKYPRVNRTVTKRS